VKHASIIESEYSERIPGIGLGNTISSVSQNVRILGFTTNSEIRLNLFYILGFIMIGILFLTLFFIAQPHRVRRGYSRQSADQPTFASTNSSPSLGSAALPYFTPVETEGDIAIDYMSRISGTPLYDTIRSEAIFMRFSSPESRAGFTIGLSKATAFSSG
jgi:hypothetical protein